MKKTSPIYLKEGNYGQQDLDILKKNKIWQTIDVYRSQLHELCEIEHPNWKLEPDFKVKQQAYIDEKLGNNPDLKGNWVYFPWSGILVHMVSEEAYWRLRTNRNKLLITAEEQAKLADYCVGITGLSVGNSIALSLAYCGTNLFKLAEFDILQTANLNRLRSGLQYIGKPKLQVVLQQIYEINPFAKISTWPHGLKKSDMDSFMNGADVVFDEIDDFEMKIRLRLAAKKAKVPVIMLTSLGDNILVDVERYDLEPNLALFNGLLGDLPEEILKTKIGEKEKIKYAMQIVGVDYIPTRALQSLKEINRTLVGRPQLFSTIMIDGGLSSYLVRRLALNLPLPSGRSYIAFNELLNLPSADDEGRNFILQQLKKVTE